MTKSEYHVVWVDDEEVEEWIRSGEHCDCHIDEHIAAMEKRLREAISAEYTNANVEFIAACELSTLRASYHGTPYIRKAPHRFFEEVDWSFPCPAVASGKAKRTYN